MYRYEYVEYECEDGKCSTKMVQREKRGTQQMKNKENMKKLLTMKVNNMNLLIFQEV